MNYETELLGCSINEVLKQFSAEDAVSD